MATELRLQRTPDRVALIRALFGSTEIFMFLAACLDLYSTLVHESRDNTFYADVAERLSFDLDRWMPAYRRRGADSMGGRLADMAERVRISGCDIGEDRPRGDVRAAVERCFPAFIDSVTVDQEAVAALGDLHRRDLRLALVSNASWYSVEILDHVWPDIRDQFDVIVLSCKVGVLKPDPVIYRRAAADLGVAATSCVFIGDGGDQELRGAREVGMATVLVDRRLRHSTEARADADIVVDGLSEIGDRLVELTPRAVSPVGT
jgi:putative hydrolase of the HAD superfamily